MKCFEKAPHSHIRIEKQKAQKLKKSSWWKQKLSEGICYYCEKKLPQTQLTMDHKVPLSRGGLSSRSNVVLSCVSCNSKKMYWTPAEIILQSELNKGDLFASQQNKEDCNK